MNLQRKQELEQRCLQMMPQLKKYIATFVYDVNDQCDILQETMISSLLNMPDLRPPYNIEGWLVTVARNHCFRWLKHRGRMEGLNDHMLAEADSRISNSPSSATYEQLICGINQLSFPLKQVIQMKYFHHSSIEEIGSLLQLPLGTVKRRLFDARKKLKKEFGMENQNRIAPEITVKSIENPKVTEIHTVGYGLFFGAPAKGLGDVEVVEAYEYPGGIFSYRACSKVTRQTTMFGHTVWEVKNSYEERKGEVNRYLYYTMDDQKLTMPLRILNFSPELRIDLDAKELMPDHERYVRIGSWENLETDNERGVVDAVSLIINGNHYPNCLRKRFSCDDYHGRCLIERFYAESGREILHRTYIGEHWKMGGFVTWEKWKSAPEVEFLQEKFRLWMDFVLMDAYCEDVN